MVRSWFSSHSERTVAYWKDSVLLKVEHRKKRGADCTVVRLLFFFLNRLFFYELRTFGGTQEKKLAGQCLGSSYLVRT